MQGWLILSNAIREYRFKCRHRTWLGFIIFLLLFFMLGFAQFEMGMERAIFYTILSVFGSRNVADIISLILVLTMMVATWKIGFAFTEFDGFAALHESYVVLNLKGKEHVVKYTQIEHVGGVGFNMFIYLKNGSEMAIHSSLKFSIRNILTTLRFIAALAKEVKNHTGKKVKSRSK